MIVQGPDTFGDALHWGKNIMLGFQQTNSVMDQNLRDKLAEPRTRRAKANIQDWPRLGRNLAL
jgi:hypothetical protein